MEDNPIAKCKCADCGLFPVMTPDSMAVFVINSEFYGIVRCLHCDRVIFDDMSKDTAVDLFWYNVIVLNWNDGTQISDQKELENI